MSTINYSIIIPHKNIPNLLQRCLDSIPKRDDIQIIVVDDNSDLEKVDFEHFPGVGEKCVEVYFTKEGKGAGYARNVGLKHVKGKWVLFADADDFYAVNAWDTFDCFIKSNYEIIYFGVDCLDTDTLLPANRNLHNNNVIDAYLKDEHKGEIKLRYTCWEPWNKMFRYDFLASYGLQFDEIPRGNDAMFVLNAGDRAQSITAIRNSLYVVTYRSNSLSFAVNKENLFSVLMLKIKINKFYTDRRLSLFVSTLYDLRQCFLYLGFQALLEALIFLFKNHAGLRCYFINPDCIKRRILFS